LADPELSTQPAAAKAPTYPPKAKNGGWDAAPSNWVFAISMVQVRPRLRDKSTSSSNANKEPLCRGSRLVGGLQERTTPTWELLGETRNGTILSDHGNQGNPIDRIPSPGLPHFLVISSNV
jgi:hypothetical protein